LEPPSYIWQLIATFLFLLSLLKLFLLSSYEATFLLLSRASLEKLTENGVTRATAMLSIYEPRHRLRLMARLGEALGFTICALTLFSIVQPLYTSNGLPDYYGILTAFLGTILAMLFVLSAPLRLRFAEESEDARIAPIAMAFVPLHTLLSPLTALLDKLTSGDYNDEEFRAEKEEELRSIVESEGESGVIEESERDMIESVFGFHDRVVREVMIPRVDIIALDQTSTLQDLLDTIRDRGHSRLPIYDESLDKIRGMIYAKDLIYLLVERRDIQLNTPLSELMDQDSLMETFDFLHAPYYVPETKKIDVLLNDMRNNRTRLAIVLDEYSGTAGLVTTEDLVEEIVGDIQDEYDEIEEMIYQWIEPERILQANARISIDDLNELMGTNLPTDAGFETLGGFIFDHLGEIPAENQRFEAEQLVLTVISVEEQRIGQVRLEYVPLPPQTENS